MTRSHAARGVGGLLALCAMAALAALVQATGCTPTDAGSDLGVVESGCRAPSACWRKDCACTRESVLSDAPSCRACNPLTESCVCDAVATTCAQPVNVCVGRAVEVCDGVGARCLPKGGSCASTGGEPPQLVASLSGKLEPRCAFLDDVCCPGVVDPDGGATD
jgi:hypothetical protein